MGMWLTDEVNWTLLDFLAAGLWLLAVRMTVYHISQRVKSRPKRLMLFAGSLLLFLIIWIELAVGIWN